MKIATAFKSSALLLTIGTLAACGGGGGGGDGAVLGGAQVDPANFGVIGTTGSADVVATVLDASEGTVSVASGVLNGAANTGNIGTYEGTLASDGSRIDVTGGGVVTFDGDVDGFAVRFDAARDDLAVQGIAGIQTPASALPGGRTTYTGDTVITAINGTDVFELTGNAEVVAAFGDNTPTVTTTLSGLSGTRQPVLGAAEPVTDTGTLAFNRSVIDGAGYSGGSAVSSSALLALSGSETVGLEGAFFGPSAEETGGVFAITGGETQIYGDFLAK